MRENGKNLLKNLLISNASFLSKKDPAFFKQHINSQNPEITLVTCSDSRVQTEIFAENAINKVFVIRNIGNQIENSMGSIDYGVLNLKTSILLILGHTDCGAIKTFLSGYKNQTESIRRELDHLHIPLTELNKEKNLEKAIEENVHWQAKLATKRYKSLIENGELTVLGGIYDFGNYYKKGYGRIVIININGTKETEKVRETLENCNLPTEIIEKAVV